jgi:outer membrane lipoprotein carrier protein
MRFFIGCVGLVLCFWLGVAGAAQQKAADTLFAQLSKVKTMTAAFSQQVTTAEGDVLQDAKGELKLKRPGYFYWHVTLPLEQLIIANTAHVVVYDPELAQATYRPLADTLKQTPAMLLMGNDPAVLSSFDVKQGDGDTFLLSSREKDSAVKQISLNFSKDAIESMSMVDALGQTTRIDFHDVRLNQTVAAHWFIFKRPKGVDAVYAQ